MKENSEKITSQVKNETKYFQYTKLYLFDF